LIPYRGFAAHMDRAQGCGAVRGKSSRPHHPCLKPREHGKPLPDRAAGTSRSACMPLPVPAQIIETGLRTDVSAA